MGAVGFMVLVVGLLLIISYHYNKKKNSRCTEETHGKLVDVRRRYNSQGTLKSMHVYAYSVNGIEYFIKTGEHSQVARNIGDSCPIWYNPKKPQDAAAYRGSNDYLKKILIVGIVMTVVGFIMSFAGFVMWTIQL